MVQERKVFSPQESEMLRKAIDRLAKTMKESGEDPDPSWYGVTIGSLDYLALATSEELARDYAYDKIGLPLEQRHIVPTFVERHGEKFQDVLTYRFGTDRRAIRVIPFTMEPWPEES